MRYNRKSDTSKPVPDHQIYSYLTALNHAKASWECLPTLIVQPGLLPNQIPDNVCKDQRPPPLHLDSTRDNDQD